MANSRNQYDIQNPLTQYPAPSFDRQPQNPPGLTAEMSPRPDHGEDSYQGLGRMAGRKVLITGADSGIGRAAAIAYAREGADLVINYLPSEEKDAKEVVALIEKAGRKATCLPGDLTSENFCQELVQKASQALGGLDLLVNVAGKQQSVANIADLTTEQFEKTYRTNVFAMFWLCKAALPLLKPGSSIINTTSVVAVHPPASLLDYASTKAAITAFTKSLAKQVAEKGIRVNAVAPGPFWTPLQPSGGQPQDVIQKFGSETLFKRPGQPAELASLYVFLATQESSYVTGEVYGATGGLA